MTYNEIWRRLAITYDESEAKAMARLLLEDMYGFSFTDIVCGATERLSDKDTQQLEEALSRLNASEPIQYVTGKAYFHNNTFHVEPGVLIPRPETEQLCDETINVMKQYKQPSILDIGTGSGCIPITIALNIPQAKVSAWDISEKALQIALQNAATLSANIDFERQDALNPPHHTEKWDAIVSNPPYICRNEKEDMEENVLAHEPHIALFVPDENPLLFYKAIARYAKTALRHSGWLFFEINPIYARNTEEMLIQNEFCDIRTIKDIFGKERYTICRKR